MIISRSDNYVHAQVHKAAKHQCGKSKIRVEHLKNCHQPGAFENRGHPKTGYDSVLPPPPPPTPHPAATPVSRSRDLPLPALGGGGACKNWASGSNRTRSGRPGEGGGGVGEAGRQAGTANAGLEREEMWPSFWVNEDGLRLHWLDNQFKILTVASSLQCGWWQRVVASRDLILFELCMNTF